VSFHPNDLQRRARAARALIALTFVFLVGAFFRTQIRDYARYALQSEQNRLSEVPLPAPRGIIYDRHGEIIAENLPGYSVSILSPSSDSLRASLLRLGGTIEITPDEIESAVRRFKRQGPTRPTVVLPDAAFDVVSVLEEHRVEFPGLIIQSTPKRYYPNGKAVASFVGYTGEITESELNSRQYRGYKPGQQVGKGGLEKQYEAELRGKEGARFVEVDARGRVVREGGARPDLQPEAAKPLYTNIDMRLQLLADSLFGDTLQGGLIAMDPKTGAVLAMHSAPSFDPNRFVGGIPRDYWQELNTDPRRPLYNKVIQGRYPPGSTFKLATTVAALEDGLVTMGDRMPTPCTGGMYFGNRYFRCWDKRGHGNITLAGAIAKSCDVYFYQLGLKLGLSRLLAGGVSLEFNRKSGIDLPNETTPIWPYSIDYFNKKYGPRGWSNASILNLSIGQGENSQTVANMARFYTALANDGYAAKPELVRRSPERQKVFTLTPEQMKGVRDAMASVVSTSGTAAGAIIQGVVIAGKTGTAQTGVYRNGVELNHAWFIGFAPANDPQVVVAVMLENVLVHGSVPAVMASKIISRYLGKQAVLGAETEG
jgi:penicillin-binding protein 2